MTERNVSNRSGKKLLIRRSNTQTVKQPRMGIARRQTRLKGESPCRPALDLSSSSFRAKSRNLLVRRARCCDYAQHDGAVYPVIIWLFCCRINIDGPTGLLSQGIRPMMQ